MKQQPVTHRHECNVHGNGGGGLTIGTGVQIVWKKDDGIGTTPAEVLQIVLERFLFEHGDTEVTTLEHLRAALDLMKGK